MGDNYTHYKDNLLFIMYTNMSGGVEAKYMILDENSAEPDAIPNNFVIYGDAVDKRVKIKFSNDTHTVLSEGGINLDFTEISFSVKPEKKSLEPYYIMGFEYVHTEGLTKTDITTRNFAGHRVCITVNSLTGSGDVVISGTYVDDTSNCPTIGTETITIDIGDSQHYSSTHRFMEVTSIAIPNSITSINYDLITLGVYNKQTTNVELIGMRTEVSKASGKTQSLRIRLWKTQDDGSNKFSKIALEDVIIDTKGITDNMVQGNRASIRTISASLFDDDQPVLFNSADYTTYFTNGESSVDSRAKPMEGFIIRLDCNSIDEVSILVRTRRQ